VSIFTDEPSMSAEITAREWVARLETNEARRTGRGLMSAREVVARRLGLPGGTLENIRRGRTKGIRSWIEERIRTAVIRELEREIVGLENELHLARQCGAHPGSDEILSAEAALASARKALMR
jgi:hypothetical protein